MPKAEPKKEITLAPCPCGGKVSFIVSSRQARGVSCKKCQSETYFYDKGGVNLSICLKDRESQEKIATAWNTREKSNCDTCITNRDFKKALEEYKALQSRLTAAETENEGLKNERVKLQSDQCELLEFKLFLTPNNGFVSLNEHNPHKPLAETIQSRIKELEGASDNLKEFTRQVIHEYCWGHEMDGLEIQDLAEKLGLIVSHIATEADVDEESDYEIGDRIYIFSEALKG